jgi:Lipoprotein LpqB beta-propeller domain/Sporulation and spore germination
VRSARLGLALVGMAVAVTACGGIPTSGQVVPHDEIDTEDTIVDVGGEAQAPLPGDTPEGIVYGFLEAMTFYEPNYETARKFLAPMAAREWQPEVATTIYDSAPVIEPTDTDRVSLTLTVAATLESSRDYTRAQSGTEREYELELQPVGGEWRIANPPTGLILRDADFDAEFRSYSLYYFDPSFSALVPDPVFLPARGRVATLLAQELLEGPSTWLAAAVATAFPDGTRLAVDAVTVTNGEAEVRLSEDALDGTEEQRTHLVTQLAWTLGQLRNVNDLVVHSGPRMLAETPVRRLPESDPAQAPVPNLFAVTDAGLVRFAEGDVAGPVPGQLGEFEGATDVAVDLRMAEAVVINEGRTSLLWSVLTGTGELEIIAEGQELRSPSFDRTGLVWAVEGSGADARLLAATTSGERVTISGDALDGRSIDAVALAADGTRIAVVSEGSVYVGLVVRTGWPADVRVQDMRRVEGSQIDGFATDVAWSQPNELAVLIRGDEETGMAERAYLVALDTMSISSQGEVPAAVSITANLREARGLVAGGADFLLRQQPTLDWVTVDSLRHPAFPG